jgi:hypothetical protein
VGVSKASSRRERFRPQARQDFLALDVSIDPRGPRLLAAAPGCRKYGKGATASSAGAAAPRPARRRRGRVPIQATPQYAHEAVAFVLTPEGTISRYLYGVEYPPRDFRLAVVEAGGGRVGTSFDKVVLSCYRYDPATRRYAPFVMAFMRIGAGLVFIALCTLLTVLWRKEIAMRKRGAQAAKAAATATGRAS